MALLGTNVKPANLNEFPAVISIVRLKNFNLIQVAEFHKCTATLVTRQNVLTAEHCLRDTLTVGFKLLIGAIDLTLGAQYFPLFIWTYENWILFRQKILESTHNDIAFIKLTENVPENIQIAPTGNVANENLYGLAFEIPGWGRLENYTVPKFLQKASVRVMTPNERRKKFQKIQGEPVHIDERFLCSMADPYMLLTEGDSGGPLFFFGAVVAINKGVSPFGNGTIMPHYIDVHLGLRYYYTYFQDIITSFHMNF